MLELPDSKKSIDQNRFPFKVGGVEYSIPNINYLTGAQSDTFDDAETASALLDFMAFGNKKLRQELGGMPKEHVKTLISEWQKDGGVSLEKSEPSDSSPESTEAL